MTDIPDVLQVAPLVVESALALVALELGLGGFFSAFLGLFLVFVLLISCRRLQGLVGIFIVRTALPVFVVVE